MALAYNPDGTVERSKDTEYHYDGAPVVIRRADFRTKTDEEIEAAEKTPEAGQERWAAV